ncbi:MAG TPA: ABC transporter permease [Burkholderiales bacterium]|jgi:ABC-type polysaccharide/polyol phosphate export permease
MHEVPVILSSQSGLLAGWRECAAGLANWRIVHLEGSAVLRRRYARSMFGQFWLTLSTAASIVILGGVWTLLWKQPAREIFAYIAVSMILWNFMSTLVTEGAGVFVASAHSLTNQGLAASTYVYALLYRNMLILAHDAVVIAVVLAVHGGVGAGALLFLPGFALALVAGFCVSYLAGMLCARYRDMILFTSTLMQLMFYVTPVLWKRDFLPPRFEWIAHANPFAAFLAIMRDPLLGLAPEPAAWAYALACAAGLVLVTLLVAGAVRRRLIYWL